MPIELPEHDRRAASTDPDEPAASPARSRPAGSGTYLCHDCGPANSDATLASITSIVDTVLPLAHPGLSTFLGWRTRDGRHCIVEEICATDTLVSLRKELANWSSAATLRAIAWRLARGLDYAYNITGRGHGSLTLDLIYGKRGDLASLRIAGFAVSKLCADQRAGLPPVVVNCADDLPDISRLLLHLMLAESDSAAIAGPWSEHAIHARRRAKQLEPLNPGWAQLVAACERRDAHAWTMLAAMGREYRGHKTVRTKLDRRLDVVAATAFPTRKLGLIFTVSQRHAHHVARLNQVEQRWERLTVEISRRALQEVAREAEAQQAQRRAIAASELELTRSSEHLTQQRSQLTLERQALDGAQQAHARAGLDLDRRAEVLRLQSESCQQREQDVMRREAIASERDRDWEQHQSAWRQQQEQWNNDRASDATRIQSLSTVLRQQEESLQRAELRAQSLQEELQSANEELASAVSERQRLLDQIQQQQRGSNDRIGAAQESAETRSAELDRLNEKLRLSTSGLEAERARAEQASSSLASEVSCRNALQAHITEQKHEIETLSRRLQDTESRLADVVPPPSTSESLARRSDALDALERRLRDEQENSRRSIATLQERLLAREMELKRQAADLAQQTQKIAARESNLAGQADNLARQAACVKARQESAHTQEAELRKQFEVLRRELAEEKSAAGKAREELGQLRSNLGTAQRETQRLREAESRLREDLGQAERREKEALATAAAAEQSGQAMATARAASERKAGAVVGGDAPAGEAPPPDARERRKFNLLWFAATAICVAAAILGWWRAGALGKILDARPLAASVGTLVVTSRPPATLFIQGIPSQMTPVVLTDLPPGALRGELKADGYEPKAFELEILPNKVIPVEYELRRTDAPPTSAVNRDTTR